MSDMIKEFFGAAKAVRLSPEERAIARGALLRNTEANPVSAEALDRHQEHTMLFASSSSYGLTSQEKSRAFHAIAAYMKQHPIRSGRSGKHVSSSVFDRMVSFFAFHRFVGAALALLLMFGGTAVYAAEGALPDDLLYNVKVNFNEPLREFAALTPERRAVWRLRKVERRLQEVGAAVSLGTMDARMAERMRGKVDASIEAFEKHIAALREAGKDVPEDMILRYESLLMQYERSSDEEGGSPHSREAARVIFRNVQEARVRSFGERARKDQEDKREMLQYFNDHVLTPPPILQENVGDRLDTARDADVMLPTVRERVKDAVQHSIQEQRDASAQRTRPEVPVRIIVPPHVKQGTVDGIKMNNVPKPNGFRHEENLIPWDVVSGNAPVR